MTSPDTREAGGASERANAGRKHIWHIYVGGYGIFSFFGTDAQAEKTMEHKRRWEQSRKAFKWRADLPSELDEITAEIATRWSEGRGVPVQMTSKRAALIRAATQPQERL